MTYPLIDLLRGVAALLVLVYHVSALGQWDVFVQPSWGLPFRQGWIGVDLFLVISGFVITLSAARELKKNPAHYRRRFMQRRLNRLVPLYALTCVLFVFFVRPEILTRSSEELLTQVISHALFIQNLSPRTHGAIGGVTWSLALEMQFYVALILCVGWLLKRRALWILTLLVSISWCWRFGTTLWLKPGEAVPHLQVIYTTQLPGTLDAFGMGIFLAMLVIRGQGVGARLLKPGWVNCCGWIVVSAGLLALAASLFLPRGYYWSYPGMVIFWRTLLAMGFGAALAAVIACPLDGGGLLRPLRYVGQISYGIYLWHFPVLLSLLTIPTLRGGALFVGVFAGSVTLASLSWHLMEKRWIRD